MKEYYLDEVEKHKDRNSLWIIIHNHVYDVTKFLDDHPGGEEVLLEKGGSDATEDFEDTGHSSDATALMKDYEIGILHKDSQMPEIKKKSNIETIEPTEKSGISTYVLPLVIAFASLLFYHLYQRMGHN